MSVLKIRNGSTWEEIPAGGVGVPSGGNAGDVLVKSNSTDYATQWSAPSNAGCIQMKLLWTNPSPTSDFAAQTITLPSNDCDFYYIRIIRDKNATTDIISPIFLKVGEKGFVRFEVGSGGIQSGSVIVYSREVTITSATQVTFAAGVIFGYASATRNDLSIPYQIYGIKGVQ